MFCKKCGNQIGDDAAFCPKCGTAVGGQSDGQENVQADVQSAPASAEVKSVPAKGKVVSSTERIESKYKVGKIITMVVFIGFSLFIPLPQDNWVLTFLIAAALLGLLGWNALSAATMFIIRKIETEQYASYINSESAEDIVKLIAQPLTAKGMRASPCNKGSNVVSVIYQGREYELYFFKEGYFNISPDRPVSMHGLEGMKIIKMPSIYEHSLEDFPIIAHCVQEALKKA